MNGQYWCRLELVGERQAVEKLRAGTGIMRCDQTWIVALLRKVEQDDLRQLGLCGNTSDRLKALHIGEMPRPAHDPLFEKRRAVAGKLHQPVIVRFKGKGMQSPESVIQEIGDTPEIGGITESSPVMLDEKADRAQ